MVSDLERRTSLIEDDFVITGKAYYFDRVDRPGDPAPDAVGYPVQQV